MASFMTLQIIEVFLKLFNFSSKPFPSILGASQVHYTSVPHVLTIGKLPSGKAKLAWRNARVPQIEYIQVFYYAIKIKG